MFKTRRPTDDIDWTGRRLACRLHSQLYTGGQKFGILTLISLYLKKTNKKKNLKTYV